MTSESSRKEQVIRAHFQQEKPPRQIHEAIVSACMYLPERPKKHALVRGLRVALASLAMMFALSGGLFGLNAVNPALAEGLPLVGGIFRSINVNGSENLRDTQRDIQKYAQPLTAPEAAPVESGGPEDASAPEGSAGRETAPVLALDVAPNGDGEQNVHITLEEAYYDGYFLYAGMRMEVEESYPEAYNRIYDKAVPGYDLLINGQGCYGWNEKGGRGMDVPGFCTLGYDTWSRTGEREYICQRAFLLPEEYWGQDSLDIELAYKGFFTYHPYRPEGEEEDKAVNTSGFSLRFAAQRSDVPIKEIDCGGITQNGVTVQRAISTPAGTLVVVDYENRYENPVIGSRFSDGYSLGGQGMCVPQDLGNGYTRDVGVWGGTRENEGRPIYLTLYDKNGSQQFEAVFKLDFQAGAIEASDASQVPEMANYAWFDTDEEAHNLYNGDYTGEMFLGSLTVESGEGRWQVFGPAGESRRHVKMEAWQNGELLGEGEANQTESSRIDNPDGSYCVFNGKFWFAVAPGQPTDVKVYDEDTGELLVEKTVTLENW